MYTPDSFLSGLLNAVSVFCCYLTYLPIGYDTSMDHKSGRQTLSIRLAFSYHQFLSLFLSYRVICLQTLRELILFFSFRKPPHTDDYRIYIPDIYLSSKLQKHISFLTSPLECFTYMSNVTCPKLTSCSPALYLFFLHSF